MQKLKLVTFGMCLAMIMNSCSTNTGNGALIGTAGGAVLGGIIGKIAGNTGVGAAVGAAVGAGTGALIGKHMDKVKAEAQAKLDNAKVEEVTDANGLKAVKVTFDSGILFALNKADLNANSKKELSEFAQVLKSNSSCSVDIQGYTDSTGNDNINLPLSQKRAESVSNYLKSCGVSSSQLVKVQGFGSANPVADNSTKAGQAQNRRVEVYLYASQEMINAANNGTLN